MRIKTWKVAPKAAEVARYVECYWFLAKECGDVGISRPKLYPDPSAHLILSGVDQGYQYRQRSVVQEGRGSHWIFPHRESFVLDHSGTFRMVGVKFRVGALYGLEPSGRSFTLDSVQPFDADGLGGRGFSSVEALVASADGDRGKVRDVLDEAMVSLFSNKREDRHGELVREILPILGKGPVSEVGSALRRSQRTIERSFLRATGLTLKQYESMIRLEKILACLYRAGRDGVDWLDVAFEHGFSDQSHLIRFIKNSIGETPGEYLMRRDLTIDVYGDFE